MDKLQLGYHNFSLKLMYFAEEGQIRVYTDCGQYHVINKLEDLPKAVLQLLRASSSATLDSIRAHE